MQEYKKTCQNCGNVWFSAVYYENDLVNKIDSIKLYQFVINGQNASPAETIIRNDLVKEYEKLNRCDKCFCNSYTCEIVNLKPEVGPFPPPPPPLPKKSSSGITFLALVLGFGVWFILGFLIEEACIYLNKYKAPSSAQIHQENIDYQNERLKQIEKRELILKIEKEIKDKAQKEKTEIEKVEKEKAEDEKKRLVLAKEESDRINRVKVIEENFRMRMEKMQKDVERIKEEAEKSNCIARASSNLPLIGSSVVIKTKYGSIIEGKLEKTTKEGVTINRGDVVMMLPKNTLSLESIKIFYSDIDIEKD